MHKYLVVWLGESTLQREVSTSYTCILGESREVSTSYKMYSARKVPSDKKWRENLSV
jgi:hypothetical protein